MMCTQCKERGCTGIKLQGRHGNRRRRRADACYLPVPFFGFSLLQALPSSSPRSEELWRVLVVFSATRRARFLLLLLLRGYAHSLVCAGWTERRRTRQREHHENITYTIIPLCLRAASGVFFYGIIKPRDAESLKELPGFPRKRERERERGAASWGPFLCVRAQYEPATERVCFKTPGSATPCFKRKGEKSTTKK